MINFFASLPHAYQGSAKQTLSLVAEAMSKDDDLWVRYFNDYVLHELRLDSEDSSSGIAQQILHTFLGQLHQLESLERIVGLHSYLHVYQLDLAKMASVLRPLNKLQKVRCNITLHLHLESINLLPCFMLQHPMMHTISYNF